MNRFASFVKHQALPIYCALTIALIIALIEGPRFIRKPTAPIEARATRSMANRST